jgi:SAM-dependent methyltransferase
MAGFEIEILEKDTTDCMWMYEPDWNYELKDFKPRYDILQFIVDVHEKDDSYRVLEIGCGYGKTLEFLSEKCPNVKLHAIEIDKIMAEHLEKECPDVFVLNKDIGLADNMPYKENSFDYIILADVLEHLHDPWTVLRNLKKYLADDGKILASIPNFGNFMVLTNCFKGYFAYGSKDIINKGHLRYFMYEDILQLFNANGFVIEEMLKNVSPVIPDYQKIFDKLLEDKIITKNVYDFIDTYQFVIKAGKTK